MIARPRHIARCDFYPVPGESQTVSGGPAGPYPHNVRLILDIDARQYPLGSHCRYARQVNALAPATFSNLQFAEATLGLRVGPWPGWRGIPEMPTITLMWGGVSLQATVQWWGDELDRGFLRAVALFPPDCSGEIRCAIADGRLHAVGLRILEDMPVRSTPHTTQILPSLAGQHPRLFVTPESLEALRVNACTSHRAHMERIRALLATPPVAPAITPEAKTPQGPERLRPEDRALLAALVAIIEPMASTREPALAALRAFVAATRQADFEPWGIDTQSGEMLFLMCVLYDWLYGIMPEGERDALRAWLWVVAEKVRVHLAPGRTDFAQAHYLGCGLGLLAFSCVCSDEHPQAAAWLAECRGAVDTILAMLPEDGSHPHGANLWIYEYGFLLRWIEILRVCTGENLWHLPHWSNASAFRAATMSSDGLYGITFGDPQYRVTGDAWCHYLIAARTGSGRAKATGDLLLHAPHEGIDFRSVPPRRRVYEFLFDDPVVVPDYNAPAVAHFPDIGQIAVRTGTDRSGLFTFRAGPPIGATRYAAGERGGYGHADPCSGSFLWYADGMLLVSGPGPVYRRDTALHNTITINGRGQIGDGTVWLPDFIPPEALSGQPKVSFDTGTVSVSVDMSHSYLPHLGVSRCFRALAIDPVRERIVGIDDVECGGSATIEWNLHSRAPFESGVCGTLRCFQANGGSRTLTGFLLEPGGGDVITAIQDFIPAYPNDGARDHALRWSTSGAHTRRVWMLTLERNPVPPAVRCFDGVVDIQFTDGTRWYFDGSRASMRTWR